MLESLAGRLNRLTPNPADYIDTARYVEALSAEDHRPIAVSVLSSYTAAILRPYVIVETARLGLRVLPYFCPFNQIEIQALNPNSELYCSRPEVIMLALQLEDLAPRLAWRYAALTGRQVDAELIDLHNRLRALVAQLRKHSDATILLFNFSAPLILDAGMADSMMEVSQSVVVSRANAIASEVSRAEAGVYVFDYARVVAEHGLRNWYDSTLCYTASIPFSLNAQIALARRLARYLRALVRPACKCLVVDLDGTLWGGVLGEDGVGGIALGEAYPGNMYKQFQRRLLSLHDQGILLAIASKNNEGEVTEVMERHPDMVLKAGHFAAAQIHWGDKATSVQKIARELNIGLEAVAFFDDSPVERAWVRQHLPGVTVIDVPLDPSQYIETLDESGAFDRMSISLEDRRRGEMVHESHQRERARNSAKSVHEFLSNLEMVATFGELGPATLPRVAQLLAKTNQFNLTTRRHTSARLESMREAGGVILWMRLRDRFGDNGLVGVAIAVPEVRSQWRIDSFLLSCRVIGRGAETAMLSTLADAVVMRGARTLLGEFIPTAKNGQTADFYPSHGFEPIDDGARCWARDLIDAPLAAPAFIRIEFDEQRERHA